MELPLTPLDFARRARKLYGDREGVIDGDCRWLADRRHEVVANSKRAALHGGAGLDSTRSSRGYAYHTAAVATTTVEDGKSNGTRHPP